MDFLNTSFNLLNTSSPFLKTFFPQSFNLDDAMFL